MNSQYKVKVLFGRKELVDEQLVNITTGYPEADMIINDLSSRSNASAHRVKQLLQKVEDLEQQIFDES